MTIELITEPSSLSYTSNKRWSLRDDGRLPGAINMAIDHKALFSEETIHPLIRFFQWSGTTVTYGYLLDSEKVKTWAAQQIPGENFPLVQRPTGGGAVLHGLNDLSLSIVWPRGEQLLPEKARDCYEVIHRNFLNALQATLAVPNLDLYVKETGSCEETSLIPKEHFSACFQEPVCNDVMMGNKKIIGGALRVTRQAILYQGSIQIDHQDQLLSLKRNIGLAFEKSF